MKRGALWAVLLLSTGCASAPRPGPTQIGIAVTVPSRNKNGARKQAVESLLSLYLTPDARREKAPEIEKALFPNPKKLKTFIGYQNASRKSMGSVVEVKVDALSAALQGAGLIRPPGYSSGPEVLLLALGNRAVGPTGLERFAADVLETALFGRGVQAQDADDQLLQLQHPITAKTEAATVKQAAAGGWAGLVTGGVSNAVHHEVQSDSWRGRARYNLSLYGIDRSTTPTRIQADGEALDVSSGAAVGGAISAAAQEAAQRVERLMTGKHVGRTTIAVFVSGYKDPAFLNHVVDDLRRTEGIEGAALISWHGLDEMALIHAYAGTLTAEELSAKLINSDPKLRITAVENDDARITLVGPQIPDSEDMGQEE